MPTTRRSMGSSGLQPLDDNIQRVAPNTPGKVVKNLKAQLEAKDAENESLRKSVAELTKVLGDLTIVKDKMPSLEPFNDLKKSKKDKDAPMPAKTAYKFFCEANPADEGVDMRPLWKECSPEKREVFTAMAQADKARFERENAVYQEEKTALEMYYDKQKQDVAMQLLEAQQAAWAALDKVQAEKKKTKKAKKDPEAPKVCFSGCRVDQRFRIFVRLTDSLTHNLSLLFSKAPHLFLHVLCERYAYLCQPEQP